MIAHSRKAYYALRVLFFSVVCMKISSLLIAFLCCIPLYSQAQTKIATVDVARLINEVPDAVNKKKELDVASEQAKTKIEAKGKELQALKIKLETAKVAADSKEADSFRSQARDFERMRADAKADLEKRFLKVNKEISDKVMSKIETYAKANSYDLVIDKSDKYRGPILFGAPSADITNEIIKTLK